MKPMKIRPQRLTHLIEKVSNLADPKAILTKESLLEAGVDLSRFRRIGIFGAGKASVRMAQALEGIETLQGRISEENFVIGVGESEALQPVSHLGRTHWASGDHPVPGKRSFSSTSELMRRSEKFGPDDAILFCLSGGASSLLECPVLEIDRGEFLMLWRQLYLIGLSIEEMNRVRQALSQVKAGKLSTIWSQPAVFTLVLSDIPGDPVDLIGSSPTWAEEDRLLSKEALDVLSKNRIVPPVSVEKYLKGSLTKKSNRSPPNFRKPLILGSNSMLLDLLTQDQDIRRLRTLLSGDTRKCARRLAEEVTGTPTSELWMTGGETDLKVTGPGQGGRALELLLEFMIQYTGKFLALSYATDGQDGNSGMAGAWADHQTLERALGLGLDPLSFQRENNTANFFKKLEQGIVTGPTGTNLNDVFGVWINPYS